MDRVEQDRVGQDRIGQDRLEQDRVGRAVGLMQEGKNCSMAVLAAFGERYGLDEETALRLGRPLGGGMGLMGLTCGAVSGGFLALGLAADQDGAEADLRPELYAKVRELARRFEEMNGTIVCQELLGLDLNTEEGAAEAKARNLIQTHCLRFVRETAEILDKMI